MSAGPLQLTVRSVAQPNAVVRVIELMRADGVALPSFAPGAHVDVKLPNGLSRSYSLVNDPDDAKRYLLGVGLDAQSRGGSRFIHQQLQPGTVLEVSSPRNHFPLAEDAAHSILIAGGIGITPILCMARRLRKFGRSWELHYVARTPEHAAFLAELEQLGPEVHLYFDQAPGGGPLPLKRLIADAAPSTHLYCCGPTGMLDAFERFAAGRDEETVHLERFAGTAPVAGKGFELVLQRSARTLRVAEGQTILQTLIGAGFKPEHSCAEGVCGTCETRVLEGRPDHHDQVLTKKERESGRVMMICCSGSLDPRLVLDI